MELLEQRILKEGQALPGNVLKVDSFLNQQIAPDLSFKMGEDFAAHFADMHIDRVLTIEASGIAIGVTTAMHLGVPLVFARKKKSILMTDEIYSAEVYSYTKKESTMILVPKKFLPAGENILIIDDFLASGEAAMTLAGIVESAGSKVAGIGIAIEKSFQPGQKRITEAGYHLYSLARIQSLENCKIEFVK